MSKSGASTLVLLSGGVLIGLALLDEGSFAAGSAYRKVWAAGLLTIALGVAADFVPEIVGPFAGLIIIAAVVKNPGKIGGFVTGNPAAQSAAKLPAAAAAKTGQAVAQSGQRIAATIPTFG